MSKSNIFVMQAQQILRHLVRRAPVIDPQGDQVVARIAAVL